MILNEPTMKTAIILFLFTLPVFADGQILLRGYKCKFYEDQWPYTMAEMYKGRDTFTLTLHIRGIWAALEGQEETPEKILQAGLKECFYDLPYHKTKDSLYYFTGKCTDGNYYYIVYIPNQQVSLTVRSDKNGPDFSEKSKWLLAQVRLHRNNYVFLVNEKGEDCQDPNENEYR
jgi:hypothetical protein